MKNIILDIVAFFILLMTLLALNGVLIPTGDLWYKVVKYQEIIWSSISFLVPLLYIIMQNRFIRRQLIPSLIRFGLIQISSWVFSILIYLKFMHYGNFEATIGFSIILILIPGLIISFLAILLGNWIGSNVKSDSQ